MLSRLNTNVFDVYHSCKELCGEHGAGVVMSAFRMCVEAAPPSTPLLHLGNFYRPGWTDVLGRAFASANKNALVRYSRATHWCHFWERGYLKIWYSC